MPNVRGMRVSANDIFIHASDGRSITLPKAEMQTIYQGTSGNAAARKAATIAEVKNRIIAALGAEQIDLSQITVDMSIAEMRVTLLSIMGIG